MKNILRASALLATLSFAGLASTFAAPAAVVDLGQFIPSIKGDFVEVDIDSNLLKFASHFAAKDNKAAADLLNKIERVRVNVVTLDDGNREPTLLRMNSIRTDLAAKGWKAIVKVRSEQGDDVVILALNEADGAIGGLMVTVVDNNKQAVFVNVVGNIRPEEIAGLADSLHIDALAKVKLAAK